MSEAPDNDIVTLVEMLRMQDELPYDDVAERLRGHSGWQQWLTMVASGGDRFGIAGMSSGLNAPLDVSGLIQPRLRAMLLEMLQPYAILLDERLPASERAIRLKAELSLEVDRFCEECMQSEALDIVAAAGAVQIANHEAKGLLRGSARASEPVQELLRAPISAQIAADTLLRSAAAARQISRKANWLQRLWNWIRGRSN